MNPEHLFNTNVASVHFLFCYTDQLDSSDALTSHLWQVLVVELKRRHRRPGKSGKCSVNAGPIGSWGWMQALN